MTEPELTVRYVWFTGARSHAAFQHFADGWEVFRRFHDAIGWFRVRPDGTLQHVWDDIPESPDARF